MELNKEINIIRNGCYHETKIDEATTIHNNKVRCDNCNKLVPIISGANFKPRNKDYENNIADAWELLADVPLEKKKSIIYLMLKDYATPVDLLYDLLQGSDKRAATIICNAYIAWKENEKDT